MTGPRNAFYWENTPEPHALRKKKILAKHPEIKTLMGPCPYTKYQVFAVVAMQLWLARLSTQLSWSWLFLIAYVIGGTANCNLQLAMHEISHNLAFKGTSSAGIAANRILSIIANLPIGIPAAIAFKKFHLDHHKYQGYDVVDVDIPSEAEGKLFRGPFAKLIWILLQPVFYSVRPLFVNPKPADSWEIFNIIVQITFDIAVTQVWGIKALVYFLAGSLLGMGLHPTAFHFISEHCVFQRGYETYSYYGPLNIVMYNVGYHNEHHDFPNIPGSRLAQVKAMAPEFYDDLPCHTSWSKVFWDYLFLSDINPYSRIKRFPKTGNTAAPSKLKRH